MNTSSKNTSGKVFEDLVFLRRHVCKQNERSLDALLKKAFIYFQVFKAKKQKGSKTNRKKHFRDAVRQRALFLQHSLLPDLPTKESFLSVWVQPKHCPVLTQPPAYCKTLKLDIPCNKRPTTKTVTLHLPADTFPEPRRQRDVGSDAPFLILRTLLLD